MAGQFGQSGLHHNCLLVLLVLVTRTTYTSLTLRVGLKLRQKFKGVAYENAENQYPRRTIRPKRPPGIHTPNSKSLTEALDRVVILMEKL